MSVLGIALLVVLVVLGARMLHKQRPKQRQRAKIKALMIECDGDQELVERLIFAEMERDPEIGFGVAAERARKRLLRDRQR